MKRRTKATKKLYRDLFDNPSLMFGNCEVLLFPNGADEIWIRDKLGRGVTIRAGVGKVGLGITFFRFSFTKDPQVRVTDKDHDQILSTEAREVSLTFYDDTERARQFSDWYDGKAEYPEEMEIS